MKKLFALLLAVVMIVSVSAVAFAAPETVGKVYIDNTNTNHTYLAYEIFAGDVDTSGTIAHLGNIRWGCNISEDGMAALATRYHVDIPAGVVVSDAYVAYEVAEALHGSGVDGAEALCKFLLDNAATYLTDENENPHHEAHATGSSAEIPVHHQGYYLVIDAPNSLDSSDVFNSSYTDYILVVVGAEDVHVNHKNSVPSFIKKVQENNTLEAGTGNTDGAFTVGNNYNDTADHAFGVEIPYVLGAALPSDLNRYSYYELEFSDSMQGMDYVQNSLKVKVRNPGESDIYLADSAFQRDISTTLTQFSVSIKMTADADGNFKLLTNTNGSVTVDASSQIFVEYKTKLNSDAIIGGQGNKNTADLKYSNNPNDTNSKGKTPIDTNVVYSYALNVQKMNAQDQTMLAGAKFKLQRTIETATGFVGDAAGWAILQPVTEDLPAGDPIDPTATVPVVTKYKITGWTTEDSATAFESITQKPVQIIGMDEGHYFLKETEAPDGYNILTQPIALAISASTGNTQSWNGSSVTLSGLQLNVNDPNHLSAAINGGAGDSTTGTVGINIANNAQSQLPTTGGMGTTLFYVVGAVLAFGAAILLVTKRRMSVEEM